MQPKILRQRSSLTSLSTNRAVEARHAPPYLALSSVSTSRAAPARARSLRSLAASWFQFWTFAGYQRSAQEGRKQAD
eukprot:superscaffoldBa00003764_g17631